MVAFSLLVWFLLSSSRNSGSDFDFDGGASTVGRAGRLGGGGFNSTETAMETPAKGVSKSHEELLESGGRDEQEEEEERWRRRKKKGETGFKTLVGRVFEKRGLSR